MKKVGELIISLALVSILLIFLFPTALRMPETVAMMLTVGLIITFLVFTSFVWQEKSYDEREEQHRLKAGRLSFFAGSAVLVAGIVLQSLNHDIDPWLVITLVVMVLTKAITRFYNQMKN